MADRGYTTEEKIEKYLGGITIATGDADDYILAAQQYIENYTNRIFKAGTSASSRLFEGTNQAYLFIDECVEVTKVEIGNDNWGDSFTEISASGSDRYYTMPANASQDGFPIYKLGLRTRTFLAGDYPNQRITAKWGYSTDVPADISQVATVIASGMYNANRTKKSGAINKKTLGEYEISYQDQQGFNDLENAISVLNNYRKIEL